MAAVMAVCGILSVLALALTRNQGIPLEELQTRSISEQEAKVAV
jgi:hypothetical protein